MENSALQRVGGLGYVCHGKACLPVLNRCDLPEARPGARDIANGALHASRNHTPKSFCLWVGG